MCSSTDALLQNRNISRIIKKSTEMLTVFSKQSDFVDFFQQNAFKIFIQVVLPFLRTSQQQRLLALEEDPKEFFAEQDDLCGDQKSGTPRCAIAKLLCEMVDRVEGFLQFVFNFVVDGVTRCFSSSSEEIDDEHLKVIVQKFNLQFKTKVEFVDVCLTVLTIISWQLPQNKGLLAQYDAFMIKLIP